MRQKILWKSPFPPALGGPFAAPLFALLSAVQNSLWMRYAALLPLPWFAIRLCLLYTIRAPLSSIIFTQQTDKCTHAAHFVGRGYIRAGQYPTSERVVFTLNVRWCPVGIYAHPTIFHQENIPGRGYGPGCWLSSMLSPMLALPVETEESRQVDAQHC